MNIYARTALAIIQAQASIIGPIAIDQARQVQGLKVIDESNVKIEGDFKQVITNLVKKYEYFFGQASIEVCKDAIREIQPSVDSKILPEILQ